MKLNLYKICCVSRCGSYFATYLQSVTVVATSEEHALTLLKQWFAETGNSFIDRPEKEWSIYLIKKNINEPGVVDTHEDSDY